MKKTDIELLGGTTEVAKLCGVKPSAVSMWFTPKERKGSGGIIPYKHAVKIAKTKIAQQKGWTIEYIVGE
jgi:hypothetical protein